MNEKQNMNITKINASEIQQGEARCFVASVAGLDWRGRRTPENRAAHGNITITQVHRPTGFWRRVNVNQQHREEGPWMHPKGYPVAAKVV